MTTPKSWDEMTPTQQQRAMDAWRPGALMRERAAQQEYDAEHPEDAEHLTELAQDEADHESISWQWEGLTDEQKFRIAEEFGVLKRPLVRDTSRNAEVVSVPCLICGRMLRLADAWIDTDGPAFRAYYHAACLPKETTR